MKYQLPCKCGLSVEIEPGQAGQVVVCSCGENLTIPSMLQVKALPIAPEKPVSPKPPRTMMSNMGRNVSFVLGIVCCILAVLWRENDFLRSMLLGIGGAFWGGAIASFLQQFVQRQMPGPPHEETGILHRVFFILGMVLLIPSLYFAVYLYLNVPHPSDVSLKRVQFSFGSNKRALFQDSTPISWQEHQILWMTDETVDNMMPMELFFYFQTLKEPMFSHNFLDNYDAIKDTYRIRVAATIILFVLSVLSIVASFFMPKRQTLVTGWSGSEWR